MIEHFQYFDNFAFAVLFIHIYDNYLILDNNNVTNVQLSPTWKTICLSGTTGTPMDVKECSGSNSHISSLSSALLHSKMSAKVETVIIKYKVFNLETTYNEN